jgi:hypothetical protein
MFSAIIMATGDASDPRTKCDASKVAYHLILVFCRWFAFAGCLLLSLGREMKICCLLLSCDKFGGSETKKIPSKDAVSSIIGHAIRWQDVALRHAMVVPSPKTGLHSLSGPIVDIVLDIIYHIMC